MTPGEFILNNIFPIGGVLLVILLIIFGIRWYTLGNPLCALGIHKWDKTSTGFFYGIVTCERCGKSDFTY